MQALAAQLALDAARAYNALAAVVPALPFDGNPAAKLGADRSLSVFLACVHIPVIHRMLMVFARPFDGHPAASGMCTDVACAMGHACVLPAPQHSPS